MSTLVIPEDNLLKKIDQSGWLTHCSRLLAASVFVAEKLHVEKASVLVHCSDGWDRTAQITSLSQILLDPFYRTIEGLAVLVEKEWCAFGHKFQYRCGHSDTPDSPLADQRSPVFLQFLHILSSIHCQFSSSFEYKSSLLVFIADHLHSGLFGNFLGNTEKERRFVLFVEEKTQSLWSYVLDNKERYLNPYYEVVEHPLWPYAGVSKMTLWEEFFMRWNPFAHPKPSASSASASASVPSPSTGVSPSYEEKRESGEWEADMGDGYIQLSSVSVSASASASSTQGAAQGEGKDSCAEEQSDQFL
jgi:hypothetical protein